MFTSNITNNNHTEIITTPTFNINLTTITENIAIINNNKNINQSIIPFNSTNNSKTSDFNNINSAINPSCNNNQINRLNMAECALIKSSQCFQDKNRIKKDLTKLTKNLLLLVGLERVAQELVGGRRWRKLTAPFNSLEPDDIQDWSPSEICYFCNSDKHDSNHNEIVKQHLDDCPLSSSTTSLSTNGIESNQLQSTNQQHQPPTSCSCLHIPNGSDINNIPNINVPIKIPVVQASPAAIKSVTAMSNVISTSEQPLDLSLHSRSVLMANEIDKFTSNHASDTSTCSSLLRIPHLNQINTKQGKKNRLETTSTITPSTSSNWKRAYTEEELQQALNDIQSGKLGTRRAAVIYGIPRSTLRNKVYKLSSERVNAKRGQGSLASSAAEATATVAAASTNVARGSAFNSAKSLSTNLPACAAVAAAAAAAAAAAHTPNMLNSASSSTNLSGPVNFLSGQKSIVSLRNNSSGKESLSSRTKSMPSKRLLKHQPVLNDEKKQNFESVLSSPPNVPKTSDNYDNDIEGEDLNDIMSNNNSLIKNDLRQFLKRALTQKAANIKPSLPSRNDTIFSNAADSNNNDHKPDFDIIDNTGPNNTMPNIITDTLQVLSSMDCANAIGPLISQILLSVHAFPLANSVNNLINTNVNHNFNKPTENMDLNNCISGTLPLIPELIHKLAQERLEAERLSSSGAGEDQDQSITNESSDRNVILKVPSYQPKLNIDTGHLKEDLIKTIIKQEGPLTKHSDAVSSIINYCGVSNPSSHSFTDSNMIKDENNNCGINDKRYKLFPVNSDESSLDALINENAKSYNNSSRRKGEKRNPITATNSNKTSDQSAPSTPDPKRNRPKRGRYRNYKRDDLAKAVKAVQNGEMSVHRAGTHFGVPHSTLEYKVKERHLLRPKKRQTTSTSGSATSLIKKDDGQSLILPKTNLTSDTLLNDPGSEPLNHPKSSILLTQREPQTQIHTQPQQHQSLEGLPMMNQVNQASLWQSALPLFPFDFGSNQNSTNFFASNMMRKLKENAQLNEENFNASSNGSPNTNNNNNSVSAISDSNQMGTTTGLKDREFGSLLLETLIKSSLERKMLNSMSNTNTDNESRLNRNTPSTIPYRFHNED